MKESFLVFIFTFLNLFLINLSKYAIDFYSTNKMQTIFGIIIMPATVISLVAQFIIHPFLLEIKDNINKKSYTKLTLLLLKLNGIVILFTIIALIGTWLIGIPVLNLIYGIKLDAYKIDLMIILIGAMFYAMTTILSNVLTTFRAIVSQTIVYSITTLLSLRLSFLLVKKYDMAGATLAYVLSMTLLFILFLLLTYKIIKKEAKK